MLYQALYVVSIPITYLDLYLLTIPHSQITSLSMEIFIHLLSDVLFRSFLYVDSYHHHR